MPGWSSVSLPSARARSYSTFSSPIRIRPSWKATIVRAIDPFLDAAADWGFVELHADPDFMVRQHLHVPPHPDAENFSSLAWQTVRFLMQPVAQKPENRFTERWMNYYGKAGTIPSISYHRALEVNAFC